jgi:hypothetical protein
MTHRQWKSIPVLEIPRWRAVFAASRSGSEVDGACPICRAERLHRYYQVGLPIEQVSEEDEFVARGACWEWCSGCHTYEHYSALVPNWWRSDLRVDDAALTAEPNALEDAVSEK